MNDKEGYMVVMKFISQYDCFVREPKFKLKLNFKSNIYNKCIMHFSKYRSVSVKVQFKYTFHLNQTLALHLCIILWSLKKACVSYFDQMSHILSN